MAKHPALEKRKDNAPPIVMPFIKRSRRGVLRGCASVDNITLFTGSPTHDREQAWVDAHYYAGLCREGLAQDDC